MRVAFKLLVRLALCSAWTWALAQKFDIAFALVFASPVWGIAFARPIIDFIAATPYAAKRHALKDLQGRNYEHRGLRIDITEDDEGWRWVRLEDARKVLPGMPSDRALQLKSPGLVDLGDDDTPARIRADALRETLTKSHEPAGLKFKVWLEREIIFPSGKGREGATASKAEFEKDAP